MSLFSDLTRASLVLAINAGAALHAQADVQTPSSNPPRLLPGKVQGFVGKPLPKKPDPPIRKAPNQVVMLVEGWCPLPLGSCSFRRIVDDVVEVFPDPSGLAYRRIFFLPKAEIPSLAPWKWKKVKGEDEASQIDNFLAEESRASFRFIMKNGKYISAYRGVAINDSEYLVPMEIHEDLISLEIHWDGGWKVPPCPYPVPPNPKRVENFPDDGVPVQFEAKETGDSLIWKVIGATHGISVLASQDGGKSWRSLFNPKNHALEDVGRFDHLNGRDYRWKIGDSNTPTPTLVSSDSGKTWYELKDRDWAEKDRATVSTDGGKTWHHPFDPLLACASKEHAIDLFEFRPIANVPARFLFQGTRGLRVYWKVFEIGKGWIMD